MTLMGKELSANGVFFGILSSFIIGLPIFAYGNITGDSMCKTIGSLVTVLLSGIVALIVSGKEAVKKC